MLSIAPVVEVADAPHGLVELKVRDSHGVRIGFCQVAADDLDDDLVNALTAWQRRHAHEALTLMPASVSA